MKISANYNLSKRLVTLAIFLIAFLSFLAISIYMYINTLKIEIAVILIFVGVVLSTLLSYLHLTHFYLMPIDYKNTLENTIQISANYNLIKKLITLIIFITTFISGIAASQYIYNLTSDISIPIVLFITTIVFSILFSLMHVVIFYLSPFKYTQEQ